MIETESSRVNFWPGLSGHLDSKVEEVVKASSYTLDSFSITLILPILVMMMVRYLALLGFPPPPCATLAGQLVAGLLLENLDHS